MDNLLKFYIDGAWVDPVATTTMPVLNPATEEQIATVALGNAADVDHGDRPDYRRPRHPFG